MEVQGGVRLAVDKELLAQSGGLRLDYLTGFFRKGFQITAARACG